MKIERMCTICGVVKEENVENFSPDKTVKAGWRSVCRVCKRERENAGKGVFVRYPPNAEEEVENYELDPPIEGEGAMDLPAIIETSQALVAEIVDDDAPCQMGKAEAEELTYMIQESEALKRIRVYQIWKGGGWKHMKCDTFTQYCEEVIDTPERTGLDWVYQVQVTMYALHISLDGLIKSSTMCGDVRGKRSGALLPTTQTRILYRLRKRPLIYQAYTEMKKLEQWGTRTPAEMQKQLLHLVTQLTPEFTEALDQGEQMPSITAMKIKIADMEDQQKAILPSEPPGEDLYETQQTQPLHIYAASRVEPLLTGWRVWFADGNGVLFAVDATDAQFTAREED